MYIVQIKLDSELLKENLNLQAWNPKVAKDLTPFSSSTALFASCASLAYFGGTVLQCTHIILDQQNGKARDCPFPHASKQMHTNKRTVHGHREPQRERESVCVSLSVHTCRLLSGHFFRRRTSVYTLGEGGDQEFVYFEFHSHLWKRKVQRPWKFSTLKLIWPMNYRILSFLQT